MSGFECSASGTTMGTWNTAWVPTYRLIVGPVRAVSGPLGVDSRMVRPARTGELRHSAICRIFATQSLFGSEIRIVSDSALQPHWFHRMATRESDANQCSWIYFSWFPKLRKRNDHAHRYGIRHYCSTLPRDAGFRAGTRGIPTAQGIGTACSVQRGHTEHTGRRH